MSDKVTKIEERIAKRKAKIQSYEESLKDEKRLLKKDEEHLAHVKYDELLKKLMQNNISEKDILEKVDEVIIEKEIESESSTSENSSSTSYTNNDENTQY